MNGMMVFGGAACNSAFLSGAFTHHHSHQYNNFSWSDGYLELAFLENL